MNGHADRSTRELVHARFRLADDLVFTPQAHGPDVWYHVESPRQGKFFRIGYAEYAFISLFDGSLSVAQALTIVARSLESRALTRAQGEQIVCWLLENRLASSADYDLTSTGGIVESQANKRFWQRLNPFNLSLSFGSPDQALSLPTRCGGWLFSKLGLFAGALLILYGAGRLFARWDAFSAHSAAVFAPNNWWLLALCWIALKALHETAHGVACKRYGGEVRDAGVVFVLFAPMPYVDVTSCWRFPSRWQRINVAAAGMYVELLVAAAAAIAWPHADSPATRQLLQNVILSASASTLIFNANPLMRFDGYYILADWLRIPNLATDGARFVRELAARVFHGTPFPPFQTGGTTRWLTCGYGVAAAAWRLLVCFSLASAAALMLHGFGRVIALAALFAWFGAPLWRAAADLRRRFQETPVVAVRACAVAGILSATAAAALFLLPVPATLTAPVVVEYADSSIVRARAAGFVDRVHVADGEEVAAGDVLLELKNDELTAKLRQQELEAAAGKLQHRQALDRHDAAAAQVARRNLQALNERRDDLKRQVEALRIFAPCSGKVVARSLARLPGTYLKAGQEILVIGDGGRKQLTLSAGQEEVDAIAPLIGQEATFRVSSRMTRSGRLQRVEPRASLELPHPALAASVGGPLAVTSGDGESANARLVEPRFRGVIELSTEASADLGVGERGYAVFGWRREKLGEYLWVRTSKSLERLLSPESGEFHARAR